MNTVTTGALELALWSLLYRGGSGHIEAGGIDSDHPGWDVLLSGGVELARAKVA